MEAEKLRKIGSGLRNFVPIEDMKGKVLVMANIKVRKLAGLPSEGMLLCASNKNSTEISLLRPNGNIG